MEATITAVERMLEARDRAADWASQMPARELLTWHWAFYTELDENIDMDTLAVKHAIEAEAEDRFGGQVEFL